VGAKFTVDTERPLIGAINGALSTDVVSDTGTQGDNLTGAQKPTLKGSAETNAQIAVLIDNKTYNTITNEVGAWSITIGDSNNPAHALAAGLWNFTAPSPSPTKRATARLAMARLSQCKPPAWTLCCVWPTTPPTVPTRCLPPT
jgi:hypothetical protein